MLLRDPLLLDEGTIHGKQIHPPLTLKYIQEILIQKKYQVEFIDCWVDSCEVEALTSIVLRSSIEIVVVWMSNHNYYWISNFASLVKAKRKDITIVVTGPDANVCPQMYVSKDSLFDVVISGEAEEEVVNIIERLNRCGNEQPLVKDYSEKLKPEPFIIKNLDNLCFPRYTAGEIKKYRLIYPLPVAKKVKWGFILSSRGCPHYCRFCSSYIRKSFGKKARFRSPGNIVREIEYLRGLGVNMISFEDDDLTLSKSHVLSICKEMKKRNININWSCHARLDELDSELLQKMKDSGCILLIIGVESGSAKVLRRLSKFSQPEKVLTEGNLLLKEAKRLGISTHLLFMLGNPGEDSDDLEKTKKLAKDLFPDAIQLHFFTPYPDTAFYYGLKDRIPEELNCRMHHYKFPSVNFSNIPDDILKNKYFQFYWEFYFNFKFIRRHIAKYFLFYLFNFSVVRDSIKIIHDMVKTRRKNECLPSS